MQDLGDLGGGNELEVGQLLAVVGGALLGNPLEDALEVEDRVGRAGVEQP